MSEPTVTPPISTEGPIVYRPISPLAIIGLGLSSLYAVLLIVAVVVAYLNSTPLALASWLLALPVGGLLLSFIALRQITSSDSTIAGERLARWGLWLGILSFLGFGAFHFATGLALQNQAHQFLVEKGEDSGFFPRLASGDINRAFLLTQQYHTRASANPDDQLAMNRRFDMPGRGGKGLLTAFYLNDVIQTAIKMGQENKTPEPLGVKSWKYERGSYIVERLYRLSNSEKEMDVIVTVQSEETNAEGGSRKWLVKWPLVQVRTKLTPLGEKIHMIRTSAGTFVGNAFKKFGKDPEHTPKIKHITNWSTLTLPDPKDVDAVRSEVDSFFAGKLAHKDQRLLPENPAQAKWEQVDGKLFVDVPFAMQAVRSPGYPGPKYMLEGICRVGTKGPYNLQENDPQTNQPDWEVISCHVSIVSPTVPPAAATIGQ